MMDSHGLHGPTVCPSTACATGGNAIGDGFNLIRLGYADLMVCGGSEVRKYQISILH